MERLTDRRLQLRLQINGYTECNVTLSFTKSLPADNSQIFLLSAKRMFAAVTLRFVAAHKGLIDNSTVHVRSQENWCTKC